jgi:hypothetical protein
MTLDAKNASGSISRRTIIKGATWSAAVMIAAVELPAAVASVPTAFPIDPASFVKGTAPTIGLVFTGFRSGTVTLDLVDGGHAFHFGSATGPTTTTVAITNDTGSVQVFSSSANKATVILRASQSSPAWSLGQTLTTTN